MENNSITAAPEYSLYREEVSAADNMANVKRSHGVNAQMYKTAHIQVIPEAGVDPSVAIWWWSPQADKFIQEHTPITKAGLGNGVAYEFSFEPMGRIFYVQVTAISGGTVDIAVSGFEREQFS